MQIVTYTFFPDQVDNVFLVSRGLRARRASPQNDDFRGTPDMKIIILSTLQNRVGVGGFPSSGSAKS